MFFKVKMQQDRWFIHFQVKLPENRKKKTYLETKKQKKKIPLMFLDFNVFTES